MQRGEKDREREREGGREGGRETETDRERERERESGRAGEGGGVVGGGKGKGWGWCTDRYVFVRSNFGLDSDTNVNMLVSVSPPKETDKRGLGHGAQPSALTSSTVIGRGRVGGCGV